MSCKEAQFIVLELMLVRKALCSHYDSLPHWTALQCNRPRLGVVINPSPALAAMFEHIRES